MLIRFVPLELKDFPSPRPDPERKNSQFKAPWAKTLKLLQRELANLCASGAVLQGGFRPGQIRNDGWPYSSARPSHPAVVLSFSDCENRALSFPCDRFRTHEENIRAIALSLQALRAVDRFGVTQRNEQYMGFKAIEAPQRMTVEMAAGFIGHFLPEEDVLSSADVYRRAYRKAAAATHPERNGGVTDGLWVKLQEAKSVLDRHFGLTVEQVAR